MELEVTREPERETAEKLRKKTLSRAELMIRATDLINLLDGRTTAKVFRARQDDPARLAYARAATAAVQAYASILRDSELDEIRERLDTIEARRA